MKKSKQGFSLLEVMVAFSLILMAGGAIGWKMHGLLEKKRFSSGVEKLTSRLEALRSFALNTQADWKGTLSQRKSGQWVLEACCIDAPGKTSSLTLEPLELFWDGQRQYRIEFFFTATGQVLPKGTLELRSAKGESRRFVFPNFFFIEEGTQKGPLHPSLLSWIVYSRENF